MLCWLINFANLAVGVISGKEVLELRVVGQAETWFNEFPNVSVYSDYFDPEVKNKIREKAEHTNLSFIVIDNKADHLVGTPWEAKWYHAQPRFLPAMKHLYETNLDKDWFLYGDDDTYLVAKNIVRRLIKYNPKDPVVVSYFYCQWTKVSSYMANQRECRPFAQAGSGVLFSKKMMEMISPYLDMCNEIYNDANHAASMRMANCIERFYGSENWTKDKFVMPWRSGFHSSDPDIVIEEGNYWDAPGSFHKVNSEKMKRIHNAHISKAKNGYFDFAHYMFMGVPVELTFNTDWEFHFGYCFDMYGTHAHRINATKEIFCIDEEKKEFLQEYQENVYVHISHDEHLEIGDIFVDDVIREPSRTDVFILINCPDKTLFVNR